MKVIVGALGQLAEVTALYCAGKAHVVILLLSLVVSISLLDSVFSVK